MLTLFWLGGYHIDACLPFSHYFWHGYYSESEQIDWNRVKSQAVKLKNISNMLLLVNIIGAEVLSMYCVTLKCRVMMVATWFKSMKIHKLTSKTRDGTLNIFLYLSMKMCMTR